MSTITSEFSKEQLIEKIQHNIAVAAKYPDVVGARLEAEIFRTALASLQTVPDYYVVVTSVGVWQTFCKTRAEAEFIVSKPFNTGYSILEIYTTPPAPAAAIPQEANRWH